MLSVCIDSLFSVPPPPSLSPRVLQMQGEQIGPLPILEELSSNILIVLCFLIPLTWILYYIIKKRLIIYVPGHPFYMIETV